MSPVTSPVAALAVILLVAGVAVWVRHAAARSYRVIPEEPPERAVPTDTRLYSAVSQCRRAQESDRQSLCHSLSDAQESLRSRLRLTELADVSIDAQYYVFHDDKSGRALLSALIAAARRGVRVRLLLDDIDLKGRVGSLSRLAADIPELQIRIFNPVWLRFARPLDYILRFPRSSRRMHNKSFTVDAVVSIVGGRNVGDEYFDVDSGVSFTDYDVLAAGRVANDIVTQFDAYWFSGIALDCAQVVDAANDEEMQVRLAQLNEALEGFEETSRSSDELAPEQLMNGTLTAFPCEGDVLFDPPAKVLGRLFDTHGNLAPRIRDLMLSARESLLISSPYFIPSDEGIELFRQLRERDIEITVLTNSYAANDVLAAHAGYVDYRKRMLELGVRMYEFKPDNPGRTRRHQLLGARRSSLHAKAFVIDQERHFVGSFNLDPRSAIHNTEMGVVFDNAQFACNLYTSLTDRLDEIAYDLGLDERHRLQWKERTGDMDVVLHHSEPDTNALQRSGVYLLSWLPVEWLL